MEKHARVSFSKTIQIFDDNLTTLKNSRETILLYLYSHSTRCEEERRKVNGERPV
jgi:hypothetical protein